MINDKNTDVKLFGFRINNTHAVITTFITIQLITPVFLQIFYATYSIIQLNYILQLNPGMSSISILIKNLISNWIYIFIYLIILLIYIYVLIMCSKTKKSQRDSEGNQTSWFGYKLTNTSFLTIGILSKLSIIIIAISFIAYITPIIHDIPSIYILTILIGIERLSLTLINIYTIIVCRKENSIYINSSSP
jgi:hypothetical protein